MPPQKRRRSSSLRALGRDSSVSVLPLDQDLSYFGQLQIVAVERLQSNMARVGALAVPLMETLRGIAIAVAIIDRGRAAESGTHGELLARGGLYARYHDIQFRGTTGSREESILADVRWVPEVPRWKTRASLASVKGKCVDDEAGAIGSADTELGSARSAAVTVVIVTFNSDRVIGDCIADVPLGCAIHVVDNASRDMTCAVVEASGRAIRLSRMVENLGFARACNHALREVATPYVLLLNPDAAITAHGLERLVGAMAATPLLAILAPRLSPHPAVPSTAEGAALRDEMQVAGACMLLEMTKLRRIGLFDENFFLYYEDSDLCVRARGLGFRVCVAENVHAFHADGASSSRMQKGDLLRQRLIAQSQSYFLEKHSPRGRRKVRRKAFAYFFTTIGCLSVGRISRACERFARLRGTLDYLVQGPAVLRQNRLTRSQMQ